VHEHLQNSDYMWIICLLPWPNGREFNLQMCADHTKTKTFGCTWYLLITCICVRYQTAKSSIVRYSILSMLTLRATSRKSISHEPNQFANIDRTPRIHGPNMQSSNSNHVHLSKSAIRFITLAYMTAKQNPAQGSMYKSSLRSLYSIFI